MIKILLYFNLEFKYKKIYKLYWIIILYLELNILKSI